MISRSTAFDRLDFLTRGLSPLMRQDKGQLDQTTQMCLPCPHEGREPPHKKVRPKNRSAETQNSSNEQIASKWIQIGKDTSFWMYKAWTAHIYEMDKSAPQERCMLNRTSLESLSTLYEFEHKYLTMRLRWKILIIHFCGLIF